MKSQIPWRLLDMSWERTMYHWNGFSDTSWHLSDSSLGAVTVLLKNLWDHPRVLHGAASNSDVYPSLIWLNTYLYRWAGDQLLRIHFLFDKYICIDEQSAGYTYHPLVRWRMPCQIVTIAILRYPTALADSAAGCRCIGCKLMGGYGDLLVPYSDTRWPSQKRWAVLGSNGHRFTRQPRIWPIWACIRRLDHRLSQKLSATRPTSNPTHTVWLCKGTEVQREWNNVLLWWTCMGL